MNIWSYIVFVVMIIILVIVLILAIYNEIIELKKIQISRQIKMSEMKLELEIKRINRIRQKKIKEQNFKYFNEK